jgi:hypothetical protein
LPVTEGVNQHPNLKHRHRQPDRVGQEKTQVINIVPEVFGFESIG